MIEVVIAALVGLAAGSVVNRAVLREPGYVIRDPKDLPDDADPSLLNELEPEPDVGDVPVLALIRPRVCRPRWLALTEVVTAACFALTIHRFGASVTGVAVLVLIMGLVAMAAVDVRVYRIPDRLNAPATAAGVAAVVIASLFHGEPKAIAGAVGGGVLYFSLLLLAHIISPRGMGFGDVKLAFVMGLYLGWLGWEDGAAGEQFAHVLGHVLLGAGLGSVIGVVLGVGYAIARRSARAVFPFGPSLAIGCATVLWLVAATPKPLVS